MLFEAGFLDEGPASCCTEETMQFEHVFIDDDPGYDGWGAVVVADFDGDGRPEFATLTDAISGAALRTVALPRECPIRIDGVSNSFAIHSAATIRSSTFDEKFVLEN
ncbi:MAG: hypothetical protein CME19_17615 [Gemmatimonadetes bacterium]|nr:hypothetical protein [Gemmatimonadota bacterium]